MGAIPDRVWPTGMWDAFARHGLAFDSSAVHFLRRADGPVDFAYYTKSGSWSAGSGAGRGLLEELRSLPSVAAVQARPGTIGIKLSEDWIAEVRELLRGEDWAGSPLAGERHVVDFLDPNLCKPLHVGHLRNLTIGHGLASLCAAAGALVTRQSFCADIGRNVCEALAGLKRARAGTDPFPGNKTDHAIGRSYARYVAEAGEDPTPADSPTSPIAREQVTRGDLADQILALWARGDAVVRGEWNRLREAVLRGQEQTLARMGMEFERYLFQSESIESALLLVEEGLKRGLLERDQEGVYYRTGREDFMTFRLVRSDGFPTEFGRSLAILRDLQQTSDGVDRYHAVVGDEWVTPGQLSEELLRKFVPCPLFDKTRMVPYAMVLVDDSKMKSSDGRAVLIDDLLDELAQDPRVRELSAESGGATTPAQLVDLLVKWFFLAKDRSKQVHFAPKRFTDPDENGGWLVARAWARACNAGGGEAVATEAKRRRWFTLMALDYSMRLHRSAQTFEFGPLLWLASELSKQFLAEQSGPELAELVQRLLQTNLRCLGILLQTGIENAWTPMPKEHLSARRRKHI